MGLGTEGDEVGVVGEPVGEVVFGEDGQVGALSGGGTDEGYGFGVVGLYCHRLRRVSWCKMTVNRGWMGEWV